MRVRGLSTGPGAVAGRGVSLRKLVVPWLLGAVTALPAGVSAYSPQDIAMLSSSGQCPGCDLRDASLTGWQLAGAGLAGADLRGADLSDSILARADLSGADLRGARMQGASMYRIDLSGANLEGQQIPGARLGRANLEQANLSLASLPGIGPATSERVIAKLRRKMPRFALMVGREASAD